VKPRRHLPLLERNYFRKVERIRRIYANSINSNNQETRMKLISWSTIRLMNDFRELNRAFLFSSCRGTKSTNGTKIFVSAQSVTDEFDFISLMATISKYPKLNNGLNKSLRTWRTRDEPPWESEILHISRELSLINLSSIENAQFYSPFYREVKVLRNHFAHENHHLWSDAKLMFMKKGISAPDVFACMTNPSHITGQLVYNEWIEAAKNYCVELCK
jgi:hypothetical protein